MYTGTVWRSICQAVIVMVWLVSIFNSVHADSFKGIYVVTPLFPDRTLSEGVISQKLIDGVYVRIPWSALEPARGQIDKDLLNKILAPVKRAGLKISLGIRAGSETPSWVYSVGARNIEFSYADRAGTTGSCRIITLPVPWDGAFLDAYDEMMRRLSGILKENNYYESVKIVKLTGINILTDELRLPSISKPRPDSCLSPATSAWVKAGYTPNKIVQAWTHLALSVNSAFPDKVLSLNVIDTNDFPLVDEAGVELRRGMEDFKRRFEDPKKTIIAAGLDLIGAERFAVQWQGLSSKKLSPVVLRAGRLGTLMGWQTNQFGGRRGSRCVSSNVQHSLPCGDETYGEIINNGVRAGASFIEVWESDALRFGGVMQRYRSILSTTRRERDLETP